MGQVRSGGSKEFKGVKGSQGYSGGLSKFKFKLKFYYIKYEQLI